MEAFIDGDKIVNPHCRCIYCRALQIIDKETYESNLMCTVNGVYACKDKKECETNFFGESTDLVKVLLDDDSITFQDEVMEITYTNKDDNIKFFGVKK